ncbi:MAG: acyl carrier protein [Planctomycetota bacterium]|jgi:acyl carrier protein|nr:acyl carrier protein [Planctomycetota bacterium]MEC7499009.1 acyl carrier protein [Planctomycetota bacterium]MEC8300645.1 acyl carrier protein [Planctomycetota bacterium]MEC8410111.1 acyl carrier protein [Planctomycetota bacterium]MEC8506340.1 acyl carrier protein [Planctomycetota bacterium]
MCNYSEQILELAKQRTGLKHDLDDEIILSGLDSLQLIEMAADLEKRFDVRIENELANIDTFRDLAAVIQSQKNTTDR